MERNSDVLESITAFLLCAINQCMKPKPLHHRPRLLACLFICTITCSFFVILGRLNLIAN